MDEVIYLEQDEEIPTVIDKLKNLEGKSVALVIPKGAAILQSVVNLKILKLESEKLNKEIALVTQDKIGRNLASQVGLSVYDGIQSSRPIIQSPRPEPDINETIELDMSQNKERTPQGVSVHHYYQEKKAENIDSSKLFSFVKPNNSTSAVAKKEPEIADNYPPLSQSQTPSPTLTQTQTQPPIQARPLTPNTWQASNLPRITDTNKKRRSVKKGLILILAILALVGLYLFYPKANITLGLKSEPIEKDLAIVVDNNINKSDVGMLSIPGELQEATNEVKQTFNATGSKDVGEKATGTIKITNPTGDMQSVDAGGEFKTSSNLVFIATESISVPKATASVDGLGNVVKSSGTANIKVQAKESGDSYNISSTSFTVINNSKLTAENTSTMAGGSSKKVTIVSENDINNARTELTNQATSKNLDDLRKKAGSQIINENSVSKEVLSFSTSKNPGDEVNSFEGTINFKSRTISFYEKDYRQMIVDALNKEITADKELILSPSDELTTASSDPDFGSGTMKLAGKVKTKVVTRINDADLKKQIVGKNQSFAEGKFRSVSGVSSVEITFRPSWLKLIPRWQKNIVIDKEVK